MSAYPITDEQVAFYQRNGYIQLPNVLSADEVETLRGYLDEVNQMTLDSRHHVSSGHYEKVFVQKVNLWTVHEGMRQYVHSQKIADIALRLSGEPAIRLWHDHALVKMPGDSRESPWHQDFPYWPMKEPGALSCWMALDDVDENNGCMQFIPTSHTWGVFEPIRLVDAQSLFDLVPDKENRSFEPVVMRMPAGSCTFHDGRTFHYASANKTDKPRRAIVTIYMPANTTYDGRGHVVTNGLNLEAGKPFDHPMFPVLAAR